MMFPKLSGSIYPRENNCQCSPWMNHILKARSLLGALNGSGASLPQTVD
jgi:hypothetical protein